LDYCIIGTAGHIDHGKTTLIGALTGIDTDRLKEEKERGISIDLGFAYLELDDKMRIGIVDVPGHEKFIKNMVAGATGMDIVVLVVAANEGVMPQTIEHLDILRFLDLKKGMVVITKTDISTEEQIANTRCDIIELVKGTFLENSPVILFSPSDSKSLEEIKNVIREFKDIPARDINVPVILPVDRVFAISGFGIVVTGTLQKGIINTGDYLEVLPQKIDVRVRNIQIHNEFSNKAVAGQRVAVNLTGVNREDIERGNWIVNKGIFTPSQFIDVSFTMLSHYGRSLKKNSRVRVHIGTNEIIGRMNFLEQEDMKPGESQIIQLILEKPVIASYGDRFIVRSYSPIETIGGGKVLQTSSVRHKYGDKKNIEYLYNLNEGKGDERLEYEILKSPFQSFSKYKDKGLEREVKYLIDKHKVFLISDNLIHVNDVKKIEEMILKLLEKLHKESPLRIGFTSLELSNIISDVKYKKELKGKLLKYFLENLANNNILENKKGRFKIREFEIKLNSRQEHLIKGISRELENNLFKPPGIQEIKDKFNMQKDARDILNYMLEHEILVLVKEDTIFHINGIRKAKEFIKEEIGKTNKINASRLRDILNTSRKYAISLLEYFDSINFTRRIGDDRILAKGE